MATIDVTVTFIFLFFFFFIGLFIYNVAFSDEREFDKQLRRKRLCGEAEEHAVKYKSDLTKLAKPPWRILMYDVVDLEAEYYFPLNIKTFYAVDTYKVENIMNIQWEFKVHIVLHVILNDFRQVICVFANYGEENEPLEET